MKLFVDKQLFQKSKIKTGINGENIAAKYLENRQYSILKRNYRKKFGEIDIIALDPLRHLVFLEVKTIKKRLYQKYDLQPEDNLSCTKLKKLRRICNFFANNHSKLGKEHGWQIDLIAILIEENRICLKHYKNI